MWEKPNEDWQEDRLYSTIRKYQPDAMIINNTGLSELGKVGHYEIDSVTFERGKPCFVDNSDKYRAGEMCQVLNDHWGYTKDDCNYKSTKELIENLIDCRKYNCNFLLNTGLKGNGKVNVLDKEILKKIGKWIKVNKDFIYNVKDGKMEINNADVMYDGEYHYIVIKNIPISGDENVVKNLNLPFITLDKKIISAIWLDSNKKIKILDDNSFEVEPFNYGESYSVRVAKVLLQM